VNAREIGTNKRDTRAGNMCIKLSDHRASGGYDAASGKC